MTRATLNFRWLSLVLGFAPVAWAEVDCKVQGFADQRLTYRKVWLNAPLAPAEFPELTSRTELNTQPKCKGENGRGYADLSVLYGYKGSYKSADRDGKATDVTDEVPYDDRAGASVLTNEAYGAYDFADGPSLLLGKKRVVWGSGFAFNPTDLMNPTKDPTDPENQRTGSWMAMGELPFGSDQLSVVASPEVQERKGGMPEKSYRYADAGAEEAEQHYLAALRYYSLIAGADVNLMAFHTNLYGDTFEKKTRWGLSVSRFFGSLGFHGEALLQRGTDQIYANPSCVGAERDAQECLFKQETPFERSRKDEKRVYPRVLAGTRYHFESDAQLIVEVLHQNDGYSQNEFQDLVSTAAYVQRNTGLTMQDVMAGQGGGEGLGGAGPMMKNYLTVHYGDYKWNDDVGLFTSLLMNLQQGSGFVGPGVNYAASDSVKLSLRALELVKTKQGVEIPGSSYRATEEELLGFKHSVLAEIKAYY